MAAVPLSALMAACVGWLAGWALAYSWLRYTAHVSMQKPDFGMFCDVKENVTEFDKLSRLTAYTVYSDMFAYWQAISLRSPWRIATTGALLRASVERHALITSALQAIETNAGHIQRAAQEERHAHMERLAGRRAA